MKILFVCPTWTEDFGIFSGIAKKRFSQPPLGILYLAAAAEKKGHTVSIIDAEVEDYSLESLVGEIIKNDYDLVGITSTSPIFHKAATLARKLKAGGLQAPIVVGGEHLNIFKKEAFFDCFDYAFFGESDVTFNAFLDVIASGSNDFSTLKGLVYRKNGEVIQTEPDVHIKDLDSLPFPTMHLLKTKRYVTTFANFKPRPYLPIMASRGCPFKCVYCSEPLTNPTVRFRSAKNIVDEMEKWCKELGITHFIFVNSNLTLKRKQIEGVCNEIIKRGLKLTFEGWTRANLVDKDMLQLLRKAGLIRMSYGLESGDPRILKIIRKEVSREEMLNAFRMTAEAGIEPACSVMLGLPGETRESVEKTIRFVNSIPHILYSNFSIANPYPGTELYQWALDGKHGINLLVKDYSEYRRYDHSPVSVNELGPEDLVRLQRIGMLRMHLKPRRIWAAVKMVGFVTLVPIFLKFVAEACQSVMSGKK